MKWLGRLFYWDIKQSFKKIFRKTMWPHEEMLIM